MTDNLSETWQEIRSGIGFSLKVMGYSLLGIACFFGGLYVCLNCIY